MNFLNTPHKLISGTNPTLFATSTNTMDFYVFNKTIKPCKLELDNKIKCYQSSKNHPYSYMAKINNNFLCQASSDNFYIKTWSDI